MKSGYAGLQLVISGCRSLLEGIRDLMYPPLCEGCGSRLDASESTLCRDCIAALPRTEGFHEKLSVAPPHYLDAAWSLYLFSERIQDLMHLLKYQQRTRIAGELIAWEASRIREMTRNWQVDGVMAIPLHRRKYRERGFNQVASAVRILSRVLDTPDQSSLIRRIRYTPSQTKLNAMERARNVAGAFRVIDMEVVAGKRILLVDDVLTTGSTANACAAELKQAGAAAVFLLTLADANRDLT